MSVDVSNNCEADGEVTLFLFVRDPVASVARPVLELKAMRKIAVAANEEARLEWRLSTDAFKFLGPDLEPSSSPAGSRSMSGRAPTRPNF